MRYCDAAKRIPCIFGCEGMCKRRRHALTNGGGGGGGFAGASLFAPMLDLGSGAVNTALEIGIGSPIFTRATAASAKLSTGLWKLDVASGVARSHYIGMDTAVGAYGGYLAEGARTNSCLWSRDMTNASWTKSASMTTAKTSTGIDGVGSSCTRCTAGAADQTALQAITLASAAKTFSVWIKRVTGTGNVFITLDNDATRTDVTSLINSSTLTLVQMTQTLANPTVGFKIATSGDAIDVDVAQLEDNAPFASTPIPTTTIAVTRNTDLLTYTFAGNADATAGTAYVEVMTEWANAAALERFIIGFGAGSLDAALRDSGGGAATAVSMSDGGNAPSKSGLTDMSTASRKRASSWGGLGLRITGDGAAVATSAFDGAMASTAIAIGNSTNGGFPLFGVLKSAILRKTQPADAQLQALTT